MPSTKLITFRLLSDIGYPQRYEKLVDAIQAENTTRFDEFTSAFLLYHVDSAQTLLDRIIARSGIYTDGRDMLCLIDLNTMQTASVGIDNPGMMQFVLAAGKNAPALSGVHPFGALMGAATGLGIRR